MPTLAEPTQGRRDMTRSFHLSAMTLLLAATAACVPVVPRPEPSPVMSRREEGVHRFKLGRLDLAVINDGSLPVANDGKVWTDPAPAEIGRVLAAAGLAADATSLDIDVLLIRTGDRIVLVDAGMGALAPTTGRLLANLAKAGVPPTAVTDVVITHGHIDHLGGLWTLGGPATFPNAKVRMTGAEWAALRASPPPGFVSTVGPQVVTFEPGETILPGLTSVQVRGHTPGHTAVRIESGGRSLLAIGDTAHHYVVSLRKPEFTISFDADPTVAEASRRALLTRAGNTREPIFSPHFPFPGLGSIRRDADGFAWTPAP